MRGKRLLKSEEKTQKIRQTAVNDIGYDRKGEHPGKENRRKLFF